MAVRVAINGFGRIGRLVFRAMVEQGLVGKNIGATGGKEVEVVAVGDIVPADNLAYLLKYDSTQGRFNGTVGSKKSSPDKPEADILLVNGAEIKVVSAKTPAELPWKELTSSLNPPACSRKRKKPRAIARPARRRSLFPLRLKAKTSRS
jgi:glyceraldehyde 3-phosphate dehydrogenase